jgi:hypothetical protein
LVDNIGSDVTLTVDEVDAVNTAVSGVFFKVGVAPNGGGMYPILAPSKAVALPGGKLSSHLLKTLPKTALVQDANIAAAAYAAADPVSQRITQVLQELPNQVLNDGITAELTSASLELYAVTATFSGRNTGDQRPIKMNVEGCDVDGCQPRFKGMNTQINYVSDSQAQQSATAVTTATGGSATMGLTTFTTAGDSIRLYSGSTTTTSGTTLVTSNVGSSTYTVTGGSTEDPADGYGILTLGKATANSANKYIKSETYEITRGTTEVTECSGRGLCDGETGACECHKGYTGEACHVQTVLV